LAQRAYRARKENTISGLQTHVSNLQSTIEEMSKSFLSFHDRVVQSELLRGNPALGQELRQITEQFFLLAKSSATPSLTDSPDSDHDEAPSSPETPNHLQMSTPVDPSRQFKDIGMGYVEYIEPENHGHITPPTDSADERNDLNMLDVYKPMTSAAPEFTILTPNGTSRKTGTSAFIPKFSIPPPFSVAANAASTPTTQLKAPYTFSIEESTFVRRIHRAAIERAYHLLSNGVANSAAMQRIFKLTFLYHTRESLVAGLQNILMKDTSQPLEAFHTPFIHLGGAGTHFSKRRFHNSFLLKAGPHGSKSRLQNVQTGFDAGLDVDIDPNHPDYVGEWFDSTDVAGYLESLGLAIEPHAVFTEARVADDSQLINVLRQNGVLNLGPEKQRGLEWGGELTRRSSEQSSMSLFPELGLGPDVNERNMSFEDPSGWLMGVGSRLPDRLDPQMPTAWDPIDALSFVQQSQSTAPATRAVTMDVGSFVECK
jgi:hypothetical protein